MISKTDNAMHWTDQTAKKIIKEHGDKKEYTIAAGITPSGVIHIGNFREIITQELVGRALQKLGKKIRFIYSWDDFDTFRKIPKDAPKQDVLKKYLRMPITMVPDVWGKEKSYARRNQVAVEKSLPKVGINPEYIYQHKKYKNLDYVEGVRKALLNKDKIKKSLDKFRTDPLPKNWLPILIYDKDTWKDTTKILSFDGKYTVEYEFEGKKKTIDLRKDNCYKLPWRVDWPMRWDYEGVDFESAGKDHGTEGGSFDTCDLILKEVWNKTPPTHFTYNFVRIKGGPGKMSSSVGNVVTLNQVLEVYTPELTRYIFSGTRPQTDFAISFETEVLQVYDNFDRAERIYYNVDKAKSKKEEINEKTIYEL